MPGPRQSRAGLHRAAAALPLLASPSHSRRPCQTRHLPQHSALAAASSSASSSLITKHSSPPPPLPSIVSSGGRRKLGGSCVCFDSANSSLERKGGKPHGERALLGWLFCSLGFMPVCTLCCRANLSVHLLHPNSIHSLHLRGKDRESCLYLPNLGQF